MSIDLVRPPTVQGLEVNELYQMVTNSVKEAKEFYQELWDRRVKFFIDLISLVLGPVVVAITTMGVFLAGEYPTWVKALLIFSLFVGTGIAVVGYRRHASKDTDFARRQVRKRR